MYLCMIKVHKIQISMYRHASFCSSSVGTLIRFLICGASKWISIFYAIHSTQWNLNNDWLAKSNLLTSFSGEAFLFLFFFFPLQKQHATRKRFCLVDMSPFSSVNHLRKWWKDLKEFPNIIACLVRS